MDKLLSLYVPDRTIIISDGAVPEHGEHNIAAVVNNLVGFERVILDCCSSSRFWKVLDNFKTDLPCYATTGIVTSYQTKDPQIKFFPSDFVNQHLLGPSNTVQEPRTHKFSCLNGNAWSHRQLAYLWLYKKPYFKDIIFSWGRKTYKEQQVEDIINNIVLTADEKEQLAQLPSWISTHEVKQSGNDRTNNHFAFTRACVNIVTETQSRIDTPSITEKTLKPIISNQFFILIGQPGCIRFLRQIGFDVFDDVIDHSYDNILDDRERIKAVISEIDRLNSLDLFEIYSRSSKRLAANKEFFFSRQFLDKIVLLEFN